MSATYMQKSGDNPCSIIKTSLVSRNITIFGKRTSIRLEPEMWASLRDMAEREGCSMHDLCSLVSMRKQQKTSLTAAIRVFIMLYYKAASSEEGHRRAGHGSFEFMKQRARIAPEHVALLEGKRRRLQQAIPSSMISGPPVQDISLCRERA